MYRVEEIETTIKSSEKQIRKVLKPETNKYVEADVIILGCSLPGIVAAHKLKQRFGDSMDIVILDLVGPKKAISKCNVTFQDHADTSDDDDDDEKTKQASKDAPTSKSILLKLLDDFGIPTPDSIINPAREKEKLYKLFQNYNGSTFVCTENYNNFTFLNFLERFELNQYQNYLDYSIVNLFIPNRTDDKSRQELGYFDRTNMEDHICSFLWFESSREVMRLTIRLVCGAPPDSVSVLFYLHQCYRSNGCRNHIDGDNTVLREKLLAYIKNRLGVKLENGVADIILSAKIQNIRQYSNEKVIVETLTGETDFVSPLLAMALNPDQLRSILVQDELAKDEVELIQKLKHTRTKKFFIQYEENFWRKEGKSGDILSLRGPIVWAIEKPKFSHTGSLSKYAGLVGYLKDVNSSGDGTQTCKEAVLDQLVHLFGQEASQPVFYKESEINSLFLPNCGDFVSLSHLRHDYVDKKLHWSAIDIYEDGDLVSAIQAGHIAYLHLVRSLRPQAQTFDDNRLVEGRTVLQGSILQGFLAKINFPNCIRAVVLGTGTCVGFLLYKFLRTRS